MFVLLTIVNTACFQVRRVLENITWCQKWDSNPRLHNKAVTVQCDASQDGLGACLIQEGKPVAFASRSLSPAERNYAQIEKKLLSIVFACEKFHQYVYGHRAVTIESDHRPLEYIWKKPLSKTPPRLQRLMLRLQLYDFKIKYVPGKYLYLADTLSRAYQTDTHDAKINQDLVQVVHSLIINLPVTTTKFDEIQQATKKTMKFYKKLRLIVRLVGQGVKKMFVYLYDPIGMCVICCML